LLKKLFLIYLGVFITSCFTKRNKHTFGNNKPFKWESSVSFWETNERIADISRKYQWHTCLSGVCQRNNFRYTFFGSATTVKRNLFYWSAIIRKY